MNLFFYRAHFEGINFTCALRTDMPRSTLLNEMQTKVSITVIIASSILFSVMILNDFSLGIYPSSAINCSILLIFIWVYCKLKRERKPFK